MRDFNLGVHQLGPGGYRVAEPIWDKEDVERAEQGLPPLTHGKEGFGSGQVSPLVPVQSRTGTHGGIGPGS